MSADVMLICRVASGAQSGNNRALDEAVRSTLANAFETYAGSGLASLAYWTTQEHTGGPSVSRVDHLLTKFGDYCEALFEELATASPSDLALLILSDDVRPTRLTFAAEILGRSTSGAVAIEPLLALLSHSSPYVREGAIYGLSYHRDPGVTQRIEAVAAYDPSSAVREAAAAALQQS